MSARTATQATAEIRLILGDAARILAQVVSDARDVAANFNPQKESRWTRENCKS